MPWYKSGTVSIVQNSSTVTGTNTTFAANARVGDAFLGPDGRWYEVANIASDTVLSLLPAYQGATTGSGTYALAPMQGYVKESADQLRLLVNKLGTLASAASSNALAAVTGSANKVPYFSAADAMALADFTAQGRSLLAAGDQAAQRNVMGLGTGATANLTTSTTDNTTGRLLKVGDFGLGGPSIAASNANTAKATGLYSLYGALNAPPQSASQMFSSDWGADPRWQSQLALGISVNRAFFRSILKDESSTTNWAEIYHTGNAVGAVSQAGGVLTGSIIERGGNANGSYVKFADGTVICNISVTPIFFNPSNIGYAWVYPVNIVQYLCGHMNVVGTIGTAKPANLGGFYSRTNTQAAVAIFSNGGYVSTDIATYGLVFDLTLIGRWF